MKFAGSGLVISKALVVWLGEAPCSLMTRLESGKDRNPEEMLAAAHAGCFTAALAFSLEAAGYAPTELSTEAVVTQETEGAGFRISHSALKLRAKVPNLPRRTFETMAWRAVNNCAISKALRTEVRLDARLL